jgi:DNA-binding SARP family transcriptional activator
MESPEEVGLAGRLRGQRILDALMVPRDRRGIVLACGLICSAAFGLGTLLATGDPIGWAYLALSLVGYLFLQTRLVPIVLWLVVAAAGALVATAGNASGWIECGLGLALAIVAVLPVAPQYRDRPATPSPVAVAHTGAAPASVPQSSTAVEDSPTQSSTSLEDSPASYTAWPADRPALTMGSDAAQVVARRRLHCLGQLEIAVDGAELSVAPRLQFLLGYLLARSVLGQNSIDRTALAEEVAPGVGPGSQKDRLRKQLYDLQAIHPAVAGMIRVTRSSVALDLDGCDFDVDKVVDTSQRLKASGELIDAQAAEEVRSLLDQTAGEFLLGFEQLELETTGGRGVAAEAVNSARLTIAADRADLVKAVAEHYVAVGRGDRALDHLTTALKESPERDDLARILVAAYLQTGQTRLATQARRDYALIEES